MEMRRTNSQPMTPAGTSNAGNHLTVKPMPTGTGGAANRSNNRAMQNPMNAGSAGKRMMPGAPGRMAFSPNAGAHSAENGLEQTPMAPSGSMSSRSLGNGRAQGSIPNAASSGNSNAQGAAATPNANSPMNAGSMPSRYRSGNSNARGAAANPNANSPTNAGSMPSRYRGGNSNAQGAAANPNANSPANAGNMGGMSSRYRGGNFRGPWMTSSSGNPGSHPKP